MSRAGDRDGKRAVNKKPRDKKTNFLMEAYLAFFLSIRATGQLKHGGYSG
jgi:hypothetical protein